MFNNLLLGIVITKSTKPCKRGVTASSFWFSACDVLVLINVVYSSFSIYD